MNKKRSKTKKLDPTKP